MQLINPILERCKGYLLGKRDSNKTTYLINIACKYLKEGHTVCFVVNSTQNKEYFLKIILNRIENKYKSKIRMLKNKELFKALHVNCLLIDEIQLIDEEYVIATLLPILVVKKGHLYITETIKDEE